MKSKKEQAAIDELKFWGVPDHLLKECANLVISMETADWSLEKRAAFVARKAGIDVGNIGPGWVKPNQPK